MCVGVLAPFNTGRHGEHCSPALIRGDGGSAITQLSTLRTLSARVCCCSSNSYTTASPSQLYVCVHKIHHVSISPILPSSDSTPAIHVQPFLICLLLPLPLPHAFLTLLAYQKLALIHIVLKKVNLLLNSISMLPAN